jgi:hypothetical protein
MHKIVFTFSVKGLSLFFNNSQLYFIKNTNKIWNANTTNENLINKI